MKFLRKLAGIIYTVYAFAVFIVIMLICIPFVALASLFGKITGGNMIYTICRIWTDAALLLWGIFHKNIFEAPKATDHPVVFVFNHISYMDIPVILKAFRREPIRILAKAEMAKVPVFGYVYKKAGIMVERKSEEGRMKSLLDMKNMLARNISIVIAPEGTFNMTHRPLKDFYNGAFKIAVEMQVAVQPVLFLDTYDRLNYNSIFSMTPGRSRAVFLPEIQPGENPERLKEEVFISMESALVRYNASWIRQ
ncbi:MAG: lysophospholipid acyltransferase family protein [Ferruginibacter sp.]